MWFLSKNMRLWETPFHPLAYHHFPIKYSCYLRGIMENIKTQRVALSNHQPGPPIF